MVDLAIEMMQELIRDRQRSKKLFEDLLGKANYNQLYAQSQVEDATKRIASLEEAILILNKSKIKSHV